MITENFTKEEIEMYISKIHERLLKRIEADPKFKRIEKAYIKRCKNLSRRSTDTPIVYTDHIKFNMKGNQFIAICGSYSKYNLLTYAIYFAVEGKSQRHLYKIYSDKTVYRISKHLKERYLERYGGNINRENWISYLEKDLIAPSMFIPSAELLKGYPDDCGYIPTLTGLILTRDKVMLTYISNDDMSKKNTDMFELLNNKLSHKERVSMRLQNY